MTGEAEAPRGMLTGADVSRLGTSRAHLAGWAPAVSLEAATPASRPLSPRHVAAPQHHSPSSLRVRGLMIWVFNELPF